MKPFNLEEAKAGKPVCTRDGRKARILCTDLVCEDFKIVVAVTNNIGEEGVYRCCLDGSCNIRATSPIDLFMVAEKHEGWVNIYRLDGGVYYCGDIYQTKDACDKHKGIATVHIEWEE